LNHQVANTEAALLKGSRKIRNRSRTIRERWLFSEVLKQLLDDAIKKGTAQPESTESSGASL